MSPLAFVRYLTFPLRTSPLILIVLSVLTLTGAQFGGLWGLPAFLIIGSWFLKYGFAMLDDVLAGRRDPPVLSYEMVNPFEQRPMGFLILLSMLYALTELIVPYAGENAVAAIRSFFVALIPAMLAAISISGRVLDALNPLSVFGIIARAPIAYALLLAVVAGLWFAAAWLLQTSDITLTQIWRKETFLPGHLAFTIGMNGLFGGVLRLTVLMYLWLATFALIGGTIYERRIEIGVEVADSPELREQRANAEVERERDKIMDRIMAQVHGGAFANAGDSIRAIVSASQKPLDELHWLYERARTLKDQRLAEYVALLALPKFLSIGATGEALDMLRERLKMNETFKPDTAGQLLQLVRLAHSAGDRLSARRLLAGFDERYPGDALSASAKKAVMEMER